MKNAFCSRDLSLSIQFRPLKYYHLKCGHTEESFALAVLSRTTNEEDLSEIGNNKEVMKTI
ncbi:hypothetical protein J437_LFUL001200 [Ladona fulva]|uniref:Uncharacterized protein n=1 Tax=Ladona fulva TaxID=123851 RepID=A0A8K0NVH3_LADFU|nr:hypothetical protein J437_LFUL001200 [Ladona fulva]